jgi:hypothetical protein
MVNRSGWDVQHLRMNSWGVSEPPRVCRMLQTLRRWSHHGQDDKQVFLPKCAPARFGWFWITRGSTHRVGQRFRRLRRRHCARGRAGLSATQASALARPRTTASRSPLWSARAAGRSRGPLLRHAQSTETGRVTQTEQPQANPSGSKARPGHAFSDLVYGVWPNLMENTLDRSIRPDDACQPGAPCWPATPSPPRLRPSGPRRRPAGDRSCLPRRYCGGNRLPDHQRSR